MRPRRSIRFVFGTAVALAVTGASATAALACPADAAQAGSATAGDAMVVEVDRAGPPDEFGQCMADHGVEVFTSSAEREGTGDGKIVFHGSAGPRDDPEHAAAFEACREYLPDGGQPGTVHCLLEPGVGEPGVVEPGVVEPGGQPTGAAGGGAPASAGDAGPIFTSSDGEGHARCRAALSPGGGPMGGTGSDPITDEQALPPLPVVL